MFPSQRRLLVCVALVMLTVLMLLLKPDRYRPAGTLVYQQLSPSASRPTAPVRYAITSLGGGEISSGKTVGSGVGGKSNSSGKISSGVGGKSNSSGKTVGSGVGGNSNSSGKISSGVGGSSNSSDIASWKAKCPAGRFVTISAKGRLGNKLCQYASLWALQEDSVHARPAWLLPEMQRALSPLVSGLALPTLPDACAKYSFAQLLQFNYFRAIGYRQFDRAAAAVEPERPVLLTDYPCDLARFHKHRAALLKQLAFRENIRAEAQRRLRKHTASLCGRTSGTEGGPSTPPCTYIGVHVRRTDYGAAVQRMYNGTLVGREYLQRALSLCRRRYTRPVFVVSSDDLAWTHRWLRAPDLVVAGSEGPDAAARDLALLAACNHTVMTHGTYGFWAAYMAGGDVFTPTGFGERDGYLSLGMRHVGMNVTVVPAF